MPFISILQPIEQLNIANVVEVNTSGDRLGLSIPQSRNKIIVETGTENIPFYMMVETGTPSNNDDWKLLGYRDGVLSGDLSTYASIPYVDSISGNLQGELTSHINSISGAHPASAISAIPSGNLTSTNIQGQVNELEVGKASVATLNEITALMTEATVLNDLASLSRSSSAYDPYNQKTVSSNVRRRRPITIGGTKYLADLVEDAGTNRALYSNDFTNAAWTKSAGVTLTANDEVGPENLVTATKIASDGADCDLSQTITITAGRGNVASLYVLADGSATAPWLRIRITSDSDTNGAQGWVNLDTFAVGTTATLGTGLLIDLIAVQDVPNSRYRRVIFCARADTAATSVTVAWRLVDADNSATAAGAGEFAHIWGAMFQDIGTFGMNQCYPSTYIATTSAAVTKSVDTLTVPRVSIPADNVDLHAGTVLSFFRPYHNVGQMLNGQYRFSQAGSNSQARLFGTVDFSGNCILEMGNTTGGSVPDITAGRNDSGGTARSANLIKTASYYDPLIVDPTLWLGAAMTYDSAGIRVYDGVGNVADTAIAISRWESATATANFRLGSPGGGTPGGWVIVLYWPRALSADEIALINEAAGVTL